MKTNTSELCPLCGGRKVVGTSTFTADLGTGIVVVRNVRATVCSQCGEEWIDHEPARKLERSVSEAREKRSLVEVTTAS
ncbi:MAG: type II toxin-antitoxin system MqsA family antitoxin [Verrucomicrobiota bacterium]